MFGKLVRFHKLKNNDEGSFISLIFGLVIGLLITMLSCVLFPIWKCVSVYFCIFITLFIFSGLSKYDNDSDRKSMLAASFLWPAAFSGAIIFWTIYSIIQLFKFIIGVHGRIENIHGKFKNIKLPKINITKIEKQKLPNIGAYRSAPDVCETCGKLTDE